MKRGAKEHLKFVWMSFLVLILVMDMFVPLMSYGTGNVNAAGEGSGTTVGPDDPSIAEPEEEPPIETPPTDGEALKFFDFTQSTLYYSNTLESRGSIGRTTPSMLVNPDSKGTWFGPLRYPTLYRGHPDDGGEYAPGNTSFQAEGRSGKVGKVTAYGFPYMDLTGPIDINYAENGGMIHESQPSTSYNVQLESRFNNSNIKTMFNGNPEYVKSTVEKHGIRELDSGKSVGNYYYIRDIAEASGAEVANKQTPENDTALEIYQTDWVDIGEFKFTQNNTFQVNKRVNFNFNGYEYVSDTKIGNVRNGLEWDITVLEGPSQGENIGGNLNSDKSESNPEKPHMKKYGGKYQSSPVTYFTPSEDGMYIVELTVTDDVKRTDSKQLCYRIGVDGGGILEGEDCKPLSPPDKEPEGEIKAVAYGVDHVLSGNTYDVYGDKSTSTGKITEWQWYGYNDGVKQKLPSTEYTGIDTPELHRYKNNTVGSNGGKEHTYLLEIKDSNGRTDSDTHTVLIVEYIEFIEASLAFESNEKAYSLSFPVKITKEEYEADEPIAISGWVTAEGSTMSSQVGEFWYFNGAQYSDIEGMKPVNQETELGHEMFERHKRIFKNNDIFTKDDAAVSMTFTFRPKSDPYIRAGLVLKSNSINMWDYAEASKKIPLEFDFDPEEIEEACQLYEIEPKEIRIKVGQIAKYEGYFSDPCLGWAPDTVTTEEGTTWSSDETIGKNLSEEGKKGQFLGVKIGETVIESTFETELGELVAVPAKLIVEEGTYEPGEDMLSWNIKSGSLAEDYFVFDAKNIPYTFNVDATINGLMNIPEGVTIPTSFNGSYNGYLKDNTLNAKHSYGGLYDTTFSKNLDINDAGEFTFKHGIQIPTSAYDDYVYKGELKPGKNEGIITLSLGTGNTNALWYVYDPIHPEMYEFKNRTGKYYLDSNDFLDRWNHISKRFLYDSSSNITNMGEIGRFPPYSVWKDKPYQIAVDNVLSGVRLCNIVEPTGDGYVVCMDNYVDGSYSPSQLGLDSGIRIPTEIIAFPITIFVQDTESELIVTPEERTVEVGETGKFKAEFVTTIYEDGEEPKVTRVDVTEDVESTWTSDQPTIAFSSPSVKGGFVGNTPDNSTPIKVSYTDSYGEKYTGSGIVHVVGEPLPPYEGGACVIEINLGDGENISSMNLVANPTGVIKESPDDGADNAAFRVLEYGIPSSERLKVQGESEKYLSDFSFQEIKGKITYKLKVTQDFELKWTIPAVMGMGEDEDGNSVEVEVTPELPISVTERPDPIEIDEVHEVSFWKIGHLLVYKFSDAAIKNYALPNGSITIPNSQIVVVNTLHDNVDENHVITKNCEDIYLGTKTIEGEDEKPEIPDWTADAESEVAGSFGTRIPDVKNDLVEHDGETYMDNNTVPSNGPKPEAIPPASKVKVEQSSLLIDPIKVNKWKTQSSIMSRYEIVTQINKTGSELSFTGTSAANKINTVTVHTPVVMYAGATDDKDYDQRVESPVREGDTDEHAFILDRPFTVELPTKGQHLNQSSSPGYGNRDFSKYVREKEVNFPFDVYSETKQAFYKKDTWIKVPIDQESATFFLPVWVPESAYTVRYRTVAINAPSLTPEEHQANLNMSYRTPNGEMSNHVAYDTVKVDVVGRIYDFRITDVQDFNFEKVFRRNIGLNRHTGNYYWVGDKTLDGGSRGNVSPYTLPIHHGSHPDGYRNVAVKTGYQFKFDVKTKGNMWNNNDAVRITPTFTFVNKDGSGKKDVDIYYHSDTNYFVKIGTEQDKEYRSVVLNAPLRNIENKQLKDTSEYIYRHASAYGHQEIVNGKSLVEFQREYERRYSKEKTVSGPYSWQILNSNLRTLIGPDASEVPGDAEVPPADVKSREQQWYGEYSLPSEIYVVEKGESIPSVGLRGGLNKKSPIFHRNGYIIVNFHIETIGNGNTGNPRLQYRQTNGANQWKLEGYRNSFVDGYGKTFNLTDGDVIFYHGDRSSIDDFGSKVTH